MHTYTYLALGDSYTIGEAVLLHESFPYQAVQLLRRKGQNFSAPEILAKTGWTTEELRNGIKNYRFQARYDFVSLLIGVNNQYRGLGVIQYKEELEELLQRAISLVNTKKDHVVIISIPDYSVTPFASSMDRKKIAREVEVFNSVSRALSIQYKIQYIDITPDSRDAEKDPQLIASDKLHPSAKEYSRWAEKCAELVLQKVK